MIVDFDDIYPLVTFPPFLFGIKLSTVTLVVAANPFLDEGVTCLGVRSSGNMGLFKRNLSSYI